MSGAEEDAGAKGVLASNRLVAVTEIDGEGVIVRVFSIVQAAAIAIALGAMIDGGPEAVGLTVEGGGGGCSARLSDGQACGLTGAS